jgi:mannose-6-phosphate isomerase-like protein (cupin superfamily)
MLIREVGDEELAPAYGILFKQVYPYAGEDASDWGFGRSVVLPGGQTTAHAHDEHEVFIVTEGWGEVTVGDETSILEAGRAVVIPAGVRHQFANASADEQLSFVNVYWPPSMGPVDL